MPYLSSSDAASWRLSEQRRKERNGENMSKSRMELDAGAIIVGAGPSGMATAACLTNLGFPSVVLERKHCIAPLWQHWTYDRLRLHIGKKFCELPFAPFPSHYPTFVAREQFVKYLKEYAEMWKIKPRFCQLVETAYFCQESGKWHVVTKAGCREHEDVQTTREYVARFLVVATGENCEAFVPKFSGLETFKGSVIHSMEYKSFSNYRDKRVLVVGCGNSGMEIALDLADGNAKPSIVVRSPLHVLPREVFGTSIFSVAMHLMKLLPVLVVDYLLVLCSKFVLGDAVAYGIRRPDEGPLELKNKYGKTPVLDVGALDKIRSGDIKIVPNVKRFTATGVEFENGRVENFDAVIFATGFRSTVRLWLKDQDKFFAEDGFPRTSFPNSWKGKNGLYVAGLGRRGLLGSAIDAQRIAKDIIQHCDTST